MKMETKWNWISTTSRDKCPLSDPSVPEVGHLKSQKLLLCQNRESANK